MSSHPTPEPHQPRWQATIPALEDRADIRALFSAVFGHELSEAFWQWKYGGGKGQAIVARDANGHMVAHYGGISRPIRYFGRSELAVQICDVMVESRERGVLTRKGPFYLVTSEFLTHYIGHGRKHLLGFGFPSDRHVRLAEKQGLYSKVGTVKELRWPTAQLLPYRISTQPLDWQAHKTDRTLDALWQDMRDSLTDCIVPVRDAAWWHFRYRQHPEHVYRVYLVKHRLTRRPLGCIALKPVSDACWELMDWIAPLASAPLMVAAARTIAAKAGIPMLSGWFGDRAVQAVSATAPETIEIGVAVPTNILTPGPPADELAGRWWLTGGDTDFR
jgi:hypothetical protein